MTSVMSARLTCAGARRTSGSVKLPASLRDRALEVHTDGSGREMIRLDGARGVALRAGHGRRNPSPRSIRSGLPG